MKKRRILTAALAVCLAALAAVGSLAYFTAVHETDNIFSTATLGSDEKLFSISFTDEAAEADAAAGEIVKTTASSGDTTTYTYAYANIAPGVAFSKTPTVENIGQYGQFVRVRVTVTNGAEWKNALGGAERLRELFNVDTAVWSESSVSEDESANAITLTYYLEDVLPVEDDEAPEANKATLFTELAIPASLSLEQMSAINGGEDATGFQVTLVAEAIQSDYLTDADGAEITACRTAFDKLWKTD